MAKRESADQDLLLEIYRRMKDHNGHQRWWPGETPLEVILGAILTQNTAWSNVEKAIANLRAEGVLSVEGLTGLEEERLARLVRPSGYFNQKARRIKCFLDWLHDRYGGSLKRMFCSRLPELREELLALKGIGPETADSILLYAAEKITFVIDAYTRRIFSRHGLVSESATYDEMKEWFEESLPRRRGLFNDYHAQIVRTAVTHCRKKPDCEACPLAYLFEVSGLPSRIRKE